MGKRKYLDLFLTFLKIGAFTFGGGYAMIPLIQRETVDNHGWITNEDVLEIVAIAESTPGPVAINSATFVGHKIGGFFGAASATAGVILPSFVIIYVISFVLRQFEELKAVQYAFDGIRAGVLALIIQALVSMYRQYPKDQVAYLIMAGAFAAVALFGVNVLLVIVCCALAGFLSAGLTERRKAGFTWICFGLSLK